MVCYVTFNNFITLLIMNINEPPHLGYPSGGPELRRMTTTRYVIAFSGLMQLCSFR